MDNLLLKAENTSSALNELECIQADSGFANKSLDLTAKDILNLTRLVPTVDGLMQSTTQFERVTPIVKSLERENQRCGSQMSNCHSTLIQCTYLKLTAPKPVVTSESPHLPAVTTTLLKRQLTPKSNECPEVRNVIASANLGCKLNLRYIAMHAKNVEYNPKLRDVLLMRIRRPFCLAFIYSSGKLICTGTKSCQAARMAARKFARVIQKLGIQIRFSYCRIDNIIASCKLNFKIRLEALELFRHKQCIYEPELDPGLVYRLPRLGSQVFAFSSGIIVLCNIRNMSKIQETFLEFYSIVQPFKK